MEKSSTTSFCCLNNSKFEYQNMTSSHSPNLRNKMTNKHATGLVVVVVLSSLWRLCEVLGPNLIGFLIFIFLIIFSQHAKFEFKMYKISNKILGR